MATAAEVVPQTKHVHEFPALKIFPNGIEQSIPTARIKPLDLFFSPDEANQLKCTDLITARVTWGEDETDSTRANVVWKEGGIFLLPNLPAFTQIDIAVTHKNGVQEEKVGWVLSPIHTEASRILQLKKTLDSANTETLPENWQMIWHFDREKKLFITAFIPPIREHDDSILLMGFANDGGYVDFFKRPRVNTMAFPNKTGVWVHEIPRTEFEEHEFRIGRGLGETTKIPHPKFVYTRDNKRKRTNALDVLSGNYLIFVHAQTHFMEQTGQLADFLDNLQPPTNGDIFPGNTPQVFLHNLSRETIEEICEALAYLGDSSQPIENIQTMVNHHMLPQQVIHAVDP